MRVEASREAAGLVTANEHALVFYGKAGFIADHEVQTRFAVGIRMHLDVTPDPPA
jgi:hypothetical protein